MLKWSEVGAITSSWQIWIKKAFTYILSYNKVMITESHQRTLDKFYEATKTKNFAYLKEHKPHLLWSIRKSEE